MGIKVTPESSEFGFWTLKHAPTSDFQPDRLIEGFPGHSLRGRVGYLLPDLLQPRRVFSPCTRGGLGGVWGDINGSEQLAAVLLSY